MKPYTTPITLCILGTFFSELNCFGDLEPFKLTDFSAMLLLQTFPEKGSDEPNICGIQGGASGWLSYVPPSNGTLFLNTDGSSFDTLLGVFVDNGSNQGYSSLIQIACDDNSGSNGLTSALQVSVAKGVEYYIMIDGKNGTYGAVNLNYQLVTNFDVPALTDANPSSMYNGSNVYHLIQLPSPIQPLPPTYVPQPTASFAATTNYPGWNPPDTMGAVGTNRLVVMINGEVQIQNRSGQVISAMNLSSWWGSVGAFSDNGAFVFAPMVAYDPYRDRWIAVAATYPNGTPVGNILVATSSTGDPADAWYQHAYPVASPYWGDQPKLGFNKDKICITYSRVLTSNGRIQGTDLMTFDKNALYSGASPACTKTILPLSTYGYHIAPATTYDTNISEVYMVQSVSGNYNSSGKGAVRLYAVSGPATNPVITTKGTAASSIGWIDVPQADYGTQSNTTVQINLGDPRFTQAVYRSGSIWCVQGVIPTTGATRSAIQFWQLKTNCSVIVNGTVEDQFGTNSYAFPSVSVNRFGDALIGFSSFSRAQFVSACYSFRAANEPSLTAFGPVGVLQAGTSAFWSADGHQRNRWGNYSATQVDPVNDTDIWTIQQYATQYSGAWTNKCGRFGLHWGFITQSIPSNDKFAAANSVSGNQGSTNGTTFRCGFEVDEPFHGGATNKASVWYTWVAPSSTNVSFVLSNNTAVSLAIYTGNAVNALTLITNADGTPPRASFMASAGTTYQVAVATTSGMGGPFTLAWCQTNAPAFVLSPWTTNMAVGEDITLASLAIGTPAPSYQWLKAGASIPNETNKTLTITNVQLSDATNYCVVASNYLGVVNSGLASLIVWPNSAARLGFTSVGADGRITTHISGLTNRPYRVEASSDLTNWIAVYTNYVSYWYTNSSLTNASMVFFRAITNN